MQGNSLVSFMGNNENAPELKYFGTPIHICGCQLFIFRCANISRIPILSSKWVSHSFELVYLQGLRVSFSATLFRSHHSLSSFLFCPFVHDLVLEKLSDAHQVHEGDPQDQGDEAANLDGQILGCSLCQNKTEYDDNMAERMILGAKHQKLRSIF